MLATKTPTLVVMDQAFSLAPSLEEDDVAILKLCQKTSEEIDQNVAPAKDAKDGQDGKKKETWVVNMIKQRFGFDKTKPNQQNISNLTYENSFDSL